MMKLHDENETTGGERFMDKIQMKTSTIKIALLIDIKSKIQGVILTVAP